MIFFAIVLLIMGDVFNPSHAATFESSACGKAKGCYQPSAGIAYSYRILSSSLIEMEFYLENVKDETVYLAVGFSENNKMGLESCVECSALEGEPLSMKFSYNNDKPTNVRIVNEEKIRPEFFFNETSLITDGTLYCRAVVKVSGYSNNSEVFTYIPNKKYHLLLASGRTKKKELRYHNKYMVSQPQTLTDYKIVKESSGLSHKVRHRLNKAHGILMVLSWLFFVPTGVLFARFMRSSWTSVKPGGLLIWFHVHRMSNLIAIALMIASFLCILISKGWKWSGPGSSSKSSTQWHTLTGVISMVLAWIQPFGSLLRCDTNDKRRTVFNWIHRLVGMLAFALASAAFAIAALDFRIWTDHALQLVLVLFPATILIVLVLIFIYINHLNSVNETNLELIESVRISLVFWTIGALAIVSIWLITLIAAGYKERI